MFLHDVAMYVANRFINDYDYGQDIVHNEPECNGQDMVHNEPECTLRMYLFIMSVPIYADWIIALSARVTST